MKCPSRVLAAIVFASAPAALGATIGVNFGNLPLNPAQVAGVAPYAQAGWNNVQSSATGRVLADGNGVATPVLLTTIGVTRFATITSTLGSDETLNGTYANSSSSTWSFSLASIPYDNYIIIAYDLQLTAGDWVGIGISGGPTYYTSSPAPTSAGYLDNNPTTAFTYTRGTSTNAVAPAPLSDYVLFEGLSGSSQSITITGTAGFLLVGGFQIVQIPEPSAWALALGGAGLLGLVARRQRGAKR